MTQDSNPNQTIPGIIVRNANAINQIHAHAQRRGGCRQLERRAAPRSLRLRPLPSARGLATQSRFLRTRCSSGREGLRVGVVRGDRVQLVPVTIGHDFGNTVEVTSGLTLADEVILDPSDSLASGIAGAFSAGELERPVMTDFPHQSHGDLSACAAGWRSRSRAAASGRNYAAHRLQLAPEFKEPAAR